MTSSRRAPGASGMGGAVCHGTVVTQTSHPHVSTQWPGGSRDLGPPWPSRARVSSARGGSPATGPPDWGPAPTTAPYRQSSPRQPEPAHNFRRMSPFPRPVSLILLESNLDFSRTERLILPSWPHLSVPGHCTRLSSATYKSGMLPPSRVLPSLSQGRLQSSPRLRLLVYLLGVTSADHHPPLPSTTFCLSPCWPVMALNSFPLLLVCLFFPLCVHECAFVHECVCP